MQRIKNQALLKRRFVSSKSIARCVSFFILFALSSLHPAFAASSLWLPKSASPGSYTTPETITTYSYLVTNTGTDTITNLDAHAGLSTITYPLTTLTTTSPDNTTRCTATYRITQADIDAGSVHNTATATGENPLAQPVTSNTSSFNGPGKSIPYTYAVTNTGNVTVLNLHIVDDKLTTGISCPQTSLAPGATTTCSGTYSTT